MRVKQPIPNINFSCPYIDHVCEILNSIGEDEDCARHFFGIQNGLQYLEEIRSINAQLRNALDSLSERVEVLEQSIEESMKTLESGFSG